MKRDLEAEVREVEMFLRGYQVRTVEMTLGQVALVRMTGERTEGKTLFEALRAITDERARRDIEKMRRQSAALAKQAGCLEQYIQKGSKEKKRKS